MKKISTLIVSFSLLAMILSACVNQNNEVIVPPTVCNDKDSAIKAALAAWITTYGQSIYDEKPFLANLNGNIWIVTSSFKQNGQFGGIAYAKIQKDDCKVLDVSHGK